MNCIKDGRYTGDSCFGCKIKVDDCEIRDKVYRNRWIPVSERLPAIIDGSLDHSELYLVTVKNDKRTYVYLAYFGSCNGFTGLFGGDWNDYVIAWQPLPEPYKDVTK